MNSYHHQAVKETAPALSVMATAEDGLVEAAYLPDKNMYGRFNGTRSFPIRQMKTAAGSFLLL